MHANLGSSATLPEYPPRNHKPEARSVVFLKDAGKIRRREGNIGGPSSEATMLIHSFTPFEEEFTLGPILLTVLAFDFEDKHFAAGETDKVVGAVFEDDASKDIEDFKAQVVVFDPCGDIGIAVKLESFAGFPTRIEHAEIDVRPNGGLA